MVLVVTNRDDFTADWLIIEFYNRDAPFVRFNTEDYPCEASLTWTPEGDPRLQLPGEDLHLGEVTAVWFRRPVPPRISKGVGQPLAAWAEREAQEALDGVWRTLRARWVNHPDANYLAGGKQEQLTRAARTGFAIPPTLVTNDARELRDFGDRYGSRLVCKPLYEGWVPSPDEDKAFWTSRFDVDDADTLDDLVGEPYLFQALVPKRYDVRVTVIGNDAFAVGIGSQSFPQSEVDWRRVGVEYLDHWIESLPESVARRCVELVAGYGLSFGAIDLARRVDGEYTFFELNPNGQWAWLEHRTGLPLRARLADLLLEAS